MNAEKNCGTWTCLSSACLTPKGSPKKFCSRYSKFLSIAGVFSLLLLLVQPVAATTVIIDTVLGNITVDLYDASTPATVTNFLNYVNDGDYDNSIVHRSVPGFVIQGGGYDVFGAPLPEDPPIGVSELVHSNLRGTISMANLGGDPTNATNQWFINLVDNPFLDTGFAVFGEVRSADLPIVDAIAALSTVDAGVPFSDLPVFDVTEPLDPSNLVVVNSVTVIPEPSSIALTLATVCLVRRSRG